MRNKSKNEEEREDFITNMIKDKIYEHEKLVKDNRTHSDLRIAHLTTAFLLIDGIHFFNTLEEYRNNLEKERDRLEQELNKQKG